MNKRMCIFLEELSKDVYPEQDSNIHRGMTEYAVKEIKKRKPSKSGVLDIGYGMGYAAKLFTELGDIYTGITLSISEQNVAASRGHNVLIIDQNQMPFQMPDCWDNKFDIVFARHVLEHSPCPVWTLHEYRRVLKGDGIIYIEVPAPSTSCHHECNKQHYSVFGIDAWMAMIIRAGFSIDDCLKHHISTAAGPDVYYSFLCTNEH
jgi:SAM-dependent methyltransferase